jgi:acyl dehydratase
VTLRLDDLAVGTTFSAVAVDNLTRTQIVQYAGASGDYNPLHTDEIYAIEIAGYPSVFAHGMLTMGLTARILTDLVGDGRLITYGGRFLSQVWPGDTLTSRAEVMGFFSEAGEHRVNLAVSTLNGEGDEVFRGSAVARIDA